MALVEKHSPGSFCWVELGTTDQNAAQSFYSALFGWTAIELPIGPSDHYTMFEVQGRPVAAGYTLRQEQCAQGVPPHWMLYVAVESADDAAAATTRLGGTLLFPPFDVLDVGRMAVLQDPTGAVFSVWQAKSHQGIGLARTDGTLCWADLSTPDSKRAQDFYTGLFGWRFERGVHDDYLHIVNGGDYIGGIPPASTRPAGVPPHWLVYFAVSDCEGASNKAKQLGATLHLPPMKMENVGTISVVADPQGAIFALFQSVRG